MAAALATVNPYEVSLQDRQWYGSDGVLDQWIDYLHRDV